MKKVSFRIRNFDEEQFLTYNIDNEADLDEDVLDFLEDEEPKGIVPIIFEEEDEFDTFSYDITGKIRLCELSNQDINAEMVLMVLRGLMLALLDMSEYRIPVSYLVLNRDYIYINSEYEVEFICIPVEDMKEDVDLSAFFRNFVASLRYDPSENGDYVAKLLSFINNSAMFNLRMMVSLVENLMVARGIEVPEDSSAEIYADYEEVEEDYIPEDMEDEFVEQQESVEESEESEVDAVAEEIVEEILEELAEEEDASESEETDMSAKIVEDILEEIMTEEDTPESEEVEEFDDIFEEIEADNVPEQDEADEQEESVDDMPEEFVEEEIVSEVGDTAESEQPVDDISEEISEETASKQEEVSEPEESEEELAARTEDVIEIIDDSLEIAEEEDAIEESTDADVQAEEDELEAPAKKESEDTAESAEKDTAEEPEEVSEQAKEQTETGTDSEESVEDSEESAPATEENVTDSEQTKASASKEKSALSFKLKSLDEESKKSEEEPEQPESENATEDEEKPTEEDKSESDSIIANLKKKVVSVMDTVANDNATKETKKTPLKTKNSPVKGVVIQDELDEYLAEKEHEEQQKEVKHGSSGLKIKKDVKVSRASVVKSSHEEMKVTDEPVTETEVVTETESAQNDDVTNNNNAAATKTTVVPKVNPYLIRVNTEERIMITKQTFKIGKAGMGVDYTVKGNGAVSRVHAIIVNKEDAYFIKDNKSTNHTFVNGKALEEGENLELIHDCKIVLGDEEFIFKLS